MPRILTLGLLLLSLQLFTACGEDEQMNFSADLTTQVVGSYTGTLEVNGAAVSVEPQTTTVTKIDDENIRLQVTTPLTADLDFTANMLSETTFATATFTYEGGRFGGAGAVNGDTFTFSLSGVEGTTTTYSFVGDRD